MTSRRSRGRACTLGLLLGVAVASAATLRTVPARAQTEEQLEEARKLFSEAYKDEQDKRFAEALEKFQRVAAVKESASVRYRIGSCLEGLGKLREARDEFRALAATKDSLPTNQQDIADSAAERAREVDKRVPRLVVETRGTPPPDFRVTVDGAPVFTGKAVELEPGEHVVAASGRGMRPFESRLRLAETSAEVGFIVPVEADAPPLSADRPSNTLAYVALGVGGALLVTGAGLLIGREGAISSVESTCPNGVCPTSARSEVEGDLDRAELFGPLGVVAVAAGIAATGFGVYLLVKPSRTDAPGARAAPALRFGPRAARGGAIIGAGLTF